MNSITEYLQKIKFWISANKQDLYIAAIIFLVGMASFGLGRLSVLWPEKEPIKITNDQFSIFNDDQTRTKETTNESASLASTVKGKYVASKNGTAYHFPWCPGALKIKEENKIWFPTKEEAESKGYKPAGNCEGL